MYTYYADFGLWEKQLIGKFNSVSEFIAALEKGLNIESDLDYIEYKLRLDNTLRGDDYEEGEYVAILEDIHKETGEVLLSRGVYVTELELKLNQLYLLS